MTSLFRIRLAPVSAEQRYAELTVDLDEVWQELYRVAAPDRRARLADKGAAMCRELGILAPETFAVELVAHAHDCMVLEHYAATERALADGELELPAEPDGSLIGRHPDTGMLWIELALSERRDRRAAVLLQLSATLGELVGADVARTLARRAETETRLVADARKPRPRRSRLPRRLAVETAVVAIVAAVPLLMGWSRDDQFTVGLVALAVGLYIALPHIRLPRRWWPLPPKR